MSRIVFVIYAAKMYQLILAAIKDILCRHNKLYTLIKLNNNIKISKDTQNLTDIISILVIINWRLLCTCLSGR